MILTGKKPKHTLLSESKVQYQCHILCVPKKYRGDDKSLAQPGRKQATAREDSEFHISYLLIYLLTAIGLTHGGSSTIHMYAQTIHRTIQNKQYIEQPNNFGRVRAVPRLG